MPTPEPKPPALDVLEMNAGVIDALKLSADDVLGVAMAATTHEAAADVLHRTAAEAGLYAVRSRDTVEIYPKGLPRHRQNRLAVAKISKLDSTPDHS